MSKYKMKWCLYNKEDTLKKCYIDNIDKDEYDNKYKGKLKCINGCKARIKFTEKKNGKKFFSTWNKEGKAHDQECEYHTKYMGIYGRKRLLAEEEKMQINDEQIEASIKRKINALKKTYRGEYEQDKKQGTNTIIPTGDMTVKVGVNDEFQGEGIISKRQNIRSMDASLIDRSHEKLYKSVYGVVENVQYKYSDEGELYGYLNLKNDYYGISVYFPTAYYEGNLIAKQVLEDSLNILKNEINNNNKKAIVICYGQIRPKKGSKNEYNIHVINPKHILINEMTIEGIYRSNNLNEIDYDIL